MLKMKNLFLYCVKSRVRYVDFLYLFLKQENLLHKLDLIFQSDTETTFYLKTMRLLYSKKKIYNFIQKFNWL